MDVEENLRRLDEGIKAFNDHDWERFLGNYAEAVVNYAPDTPEPVKGRPALGERLRAFAAAIPDQKLEKVRAFGQGDWMCLEAVFTGTHKGPLPGPGGEMIPATNKTFRVPALLLFKIEDDKVIEERDYYDNLGFMTQLGLAPKGGP